MLPLDRPMSCVILLLRHSTKKSFERIEFRLFHTLFHSCLLFCAGDFVGNRGLANVCAKLFSGGRAPRGVLWAFVQRLCTRLFFFEINAPSRCGVRCVLDRELWNRLAVCLCKHRDLFVCVALVIRSK